MATDRSSPHSSKASVWGDLLLVFLTAIAQALLIVTNLFYIGQLEESVAKYGGAFPYLGVRVLMAGGVPAVFFALIAALLLRLLKKYR